jgi:toxin FitB
VRRYLLDTNILSNATKPQPSEPLVEWLAQQIDDTLFIASLTLAEIKRGILEKPSGKKRRELEKWFANAALSLFAGRVLPFDDRAGLIWARLMAEGTAQGRPRSPLDMIIASVAEANDCTLVTDNTQHFVGIKTLNPMQTES